MRVYCVLCDCVCSVHIYKIIHAYIFSRVSICCYSFEREMQIRNTWTKIVEKDCDVVNHSKSTNSAHPIDISSTLDVFPKWSPSKLPRPLPFRVPNWDILCIHSHKMLSFDPVDILFGRLVRLRMEEQSSEVYGDCWTVSVLKVNCWTVWYPPMLFLHRVKASSWTWIRKNTGIRNSSKL